MEVTGSEGYESDGFPVKSEEPLASWTLEDPTTKSTRRRIATVYDAVAGRVNNRGPTDLHDGVEKPGNSLSQSRRGKRYNKRETFRPPDEVLFRRKDAPDRYEEYDIYNSHERDLPRGGRGILPESDLLKAIHGYSSQFYGAMGRRRQRDIGDGINVDECSMDETALIAFGVLLEEATHEILGREGELVFTEGINDGDMPTSNQSFVRSGDHSAAAHGLDSDTQTQPKKKRRTIKVEKTPWG